MSARLVFSGGKFKLVSYEFFTPTISFNESDLRAPFKVSTKVSRRDRFNEVKGLYTSILHLGRPSNYPTATRAIYKTNDNNEQLLREINFPYTPSQTMAQRLGRIELEKHRQEIRVGLPLKLTGMLVTAGDTIQLSLSDMGWTNKVFEVMEWKFVVDQDPEGNTIFGVDLQVKETASTIWDWDETVDETSLPDDLAKDTDLPNSGFINPPTNIAVSESTFTTSSSSYVQVRLLVSWLASGGPYLDHYELEFKRSTDSTFQIMPNTAEITQEINDVETAITYNLRVRAVNAVGVASAYTTLNHDVFGLSARPGDVTNCVIHIVGENIVLITIDPTVDDDVRLSGKVLVRHDEDVLSGDWINSVSVYTSTNSGELATGGTIVAGTKTQFFAPLKTGTYLIKFQDSAGFTSVNACGVVVTRFSTDGYQTLATITENPTFSGTQSNTTVADGLLRLELYSDVSPSTDVISFGTYTFNNSFNFGAQKKVRITSGISVTIVDENDLIDSRADNIDSWIDFDGILGEEADAQMFIRYQTSDPAASPTPDFSAWQSIQTQGVFDIWTAEFRVELSSFDTSTNIHIDTLTMVADEKLAL
jgi:hypothetical protein